MKKGQTTVFIIIALIVVGLVGVFFLLRGDGVSVDRTEINPDVVPVYSFVQDCIESVGEDAVYYVGQTGGYVIVPEDSLQLETDEGWVGEIAYYLYEGENKMPLKMDVESELSLYMNNFLKFCVGEFEDFSDFEIDDGGVRSDVKIEGDKVIFDVMYNLDIVRGENSYEIDEFNGVEVVVRLGEIYEAIDEIMISQMEKTDAVCISCLQGIAQNHDLMVRMTEDEGGIVFGIVDAKSRIYESNYEFYFANKYGEIGI